MNNGTSPFSTGRVREHLSAHHLDPDRADAYAALLDRHAAPDAGAAPDAPVWLASAPGRTELAGNHTDHNLGKVLAASINLDSIAVASPRTDGIVRLESEGFATVEVSSDDLTARPEEEGTSAALVRGVLAGLVQEGFRVGGCTIHASSTVLPGSGLSSSASFEVLFGAVQNGLHNGGRIGPTRLAQIGRFAENVYFGKPSGLMDQVACATGGGVTIDFADERNPVIKQVRVSFADAGLALVVVDTGGSHADLTAEYAAIPSDMRAVAGELGADSLGNLDASAFFPQIRRLRPLVGDRAVSRAIHFYEENERVVRMVVALEGGDIAEYTRLMAESGRSSGLFLQNCAPATAPRDQGVVVALALTERFFTAKSLRSGRQAATRVHGGGFAGTIQTLLPLDRVDDYAAAMADVFGPGSSTVLHIRDTGAVAFPLEEL